VSEVLSSVVWLQIAALRPPVAKNAAAKRASDGNGDAPEKITHFEDSFLDHIYVKTLAKYQATMMQAKEMLRDDVVGIQ
jgi:hypothetical protein